MMLHKINVLKLCRLCGKENQLGTELYEDEIKGSVLISIINKYFAKEVLNISISDSLSKFVCSECEKKIYTFDEFCLMVANVQKQLSAPILEVNFAEDILSHLKDTNESEKLIRKKNSSIIEKKHVCPICTKSFRFLAHLNRHKLIHTGQRPYICDTCNMTFNQKEILVKHKETHNRKKFFECAHCHETFCYKASLKNHVINHHTTNEPLFINNKITCLQNQSLYICTECGKKFGSKYKLQRHARCHTGEKPFQCNYCNNSFSQSCNLKLHQIKCHQITPSIAGIQGPPQHAMNQPTECNVDNSFNSFSSIYITETEIQNTINETINSTDPNSSYMNKSYENPLYIDEEIETMLDQDLDQLERQKYAETTQEKVSFCLKQPETPELIHSLLYDDC